MVVFLVREAAGIVRVRGKGVWFFVVEKTSAFWRAYFFGFGFGVPWVPRPGA
jgi:hypothetical protein